MHSISALSRHFLPLLLLIPIGLLGCSSSESKKEGSNEEIASEVGGSNLQEYRYDELHQVEDFELTERDGQPFGRQDLEGKVWIASFFFSTCKFECSDQNRTIRDEVHEKLRGIDFTVVSITCDPQTDTPDVLNTYAKEFTTVPEKWKFLTGPLDQIKAIGDDSFKVIVDPKSHSKRLLLVDKWGKFRDSFEWKEPQDLVRLRKVAKMLAAEEKRPAPDEIVKTRALPESVFQLDNKPHGDTSDTAANSPEATADQSQTAERDPNWPAWRNADWLTSFELTDSNGETFRSEDLKGQVWVANFFFTSCTGACPRLLDAVAELRQQLGDRKIAFVSISNDPKKDTPEVLRDYKQRFKDADDWRFLTGTEQLQIKAIGSEFFNVHAGEGETHSEEMIVIDKWGQYRGHFRYHNPEEMTKMRLLLDDLLAEKEPPKKK